MKHFLFAITCLIASIETYAASSSCIATDESGRNTTPIQFTIDTQSTGTKISFQDKIAFYPEALNFEVLYSGVIGEKYVFAALSTEGQQPQIVELEFASKRAHGGDRSIGSLRAGDQQHATKRIGKHRDYTVTCSN